MKRYFLCSTPLSSWEHSGSAFHYIDLKNGARAIVMMDSEFAPVKDWQELPHLLDASTKMHPDHASALAHLGVQASDSTYQVAKKLAAIHPFFHP